MSTATQITTNQQNAQLSTGPKSAEGKATSAQNAVKHGFTISDDRMLIQHRTEIQEITEKYRRQFPSTAPTAHHLRNLLACSTLRQQILEIRSLELLEKVELDDPILARVERYRAAAERSFYRALKELQALVQNEATPEPTAETEIGETKPIRPTMEQLRKLHPHTDRNQLARIRANWAQ